MGLKAVELQVAIPRTGDAGNVQSQLLQKPIHDQDMLAAAAAKQMEQMRKKSNAVNKADEQLQADRDGSNPHSGHGKQHHAKSNHTAETETIEHPYKGHHIDYSL